MSKVREKEIFLEPRHGPFTRLHGDFGHWTLDVGPGFCQKVKRAPNWSLRIDAALVITPKVAEVEPAAGTELPGCPRFTKLKTLVPSARRLILYLSLKRMSRVIARSTT